MVDVATANDYYHFILDSPDVIKLFRAPCASSVPNMWDCGICGHGNGDLEDYCGCCGAWIYEP